MKTSKQQFTIYETRTHLSRLLKRVEKGEEIIVMNGSRPVARIVAVVPPAKKRVPGSAKGTLVMTDDFDAPLPEQFMKAFR